jgi:hypothetical protein
MARIFKSCTNTSRTKKLALILIGALLFMTTQTNAEDEKGIIGKVHENGLPVIYKFINEMPPTSIRDQLQWLTVISWKYDGAPNNGMPQADENQRMVILEDIFEEKIEHNLALRHVYSRTGNNLKELVYYIHNQDQFLEAFNKAMSSQPRYPIDINFYEDKVWEDFQKVLNDFSKNG